MNVTIKTAPVLWPIDLDLAKEQVRIESYLTDQDGVLSLYIDAATTWVEEYTGRSLMTQTWQMSLPAFPSRLWLPRSVPLASITHVKYYDTSNVLQTLSSSVYTVPAFAEPACLTLAYAQVWPSVYDRDDSVQVEYVTGATSADRVPAPLRQAVQLLVGHWYNQREDVTTNGSVAKQVPMAAEALCAPYRRFVRRPEWCAA